MWAMREFHQQAEMFPRITCYAGTSDNCTVQCLRRAKENLEKFGVHSQSSSNSIWLVVWNIWKPGWLILHGFLVAGDWNHGMDYDFPIHIGNVIIPTDEVHPFSDGLKPPTR